MTANQQPPAQFSATYTVRAGDIDPAYRLKPCRLFACLQDAAARHSADMGIAAYDLARRGCTWMIIGMRVAFEAPLPFWRRPLTVTTWLRKTTTVRFLRDFIASDEKGTVVARGTSLWSILHIETRRPQRASKVIGIPPIVDRLALEDCAFSRLESFDGGPRHHAEYHVSSDDIDFNRHLNNIRYLTTALEAIPQDYRLDHTPTLMDVRFMKEAFAGDRILSTCHQKGHRFFHHLSRNTEEDAPLCHLLTEWCFSTAEVDKMFSPNKVTIPPL